MTELDRLMSIPPANDEIRQLTTKKGFIDSYEALLSCCKTYKSAYEVLELQCLRILGHRIYSNYEVFKVVYNRKIKQQNKKK